MYIAAGFPLSAVAEKRRSPISRQHTERGTEKVGFCRLKITSRQNETVKKAVRLRSCPSADGFIVEGARFVTEIAPENIKEVFCSCPDEFSDFFEKLGDVPVYDVAEPVMEKLCGVVGAQKLCAVVSKKNPERPNRLVVLDGVRDPGNAGTIIRTAAAFGFGCVFSDDSANPFSEKVVRGTAGAILPVYIERVNLSDAIASLKEEGFSVISSELDETARKLSDFPKNVEKIALIVGNEGKGVSPAVSATANEKLYIPIKNTNSLNAAVAAAIMMHYFSEV